MQPSFRTPAGLAEPADVAALQAFLQSSRRLFVLTGAGCSTESGIPDYRDHSGAWKRSPPVDYASFVGQAPVRQRYWARSLVGWRHFRGAVPNPAHQALAQLEAAGRLIGLVTQNVDGLHQAAGSQHVIDLHGRIDRVGCLRCQHRFERAHYQTWLEQHNRAWLPVQAAMAPDGDADLEGVDFSRFVVPNCPRCGGIIKPDVVFFGEAVPRHRVDQAWSWLAQADAMLVVGSSLMLYSGFRFARAAAERGLPLAALNQGQTRADALLTLKVQASASQLAQAVAPA